MRDVDEWIRELRGPPTTAAAPVWPRERRRWWVPVLALAAAAALIVGLWTAPGAGTRGGIGAPTFELRLVVERGGVAVRLPSSPLQVGERVYFRVAASRATEARIWVEGPLGREELGAIPVDVRPRDLSDGAGLTAYEFDVPGTYLFQASEDGTCHSCPTVAVEVR